MRPVNALFPSNIRENQAHGQHWCVFNQKCLMAQYVINQEFHNQLWKFEVADLVLDPDRRVSNLL